MNHTDNQSQPYSTVAERVQRAATSENTCKLRKQLPQFDNKHAANAHNTTKKRNALQIEKNTCKLRKHFRQFDNAHAANAHNTTKKKKRAANKMLRCVVSICTICCQNYENIFFKCFLKLQRVELSWPPYYTICIPHTHTHTHAVGLIYKTNVRPKIWIYQYGREWWLWSNLTSRVCKFLS